MNLELDIDVTDELIERGVPEANYCPVSLAVNRALRAAGHPTWRASFVPYNGRTGGLAIEHEGTTAKHVLCRLPLGDCPKEAVDFAVRFDRALGKEDPDEIEEMMPPPFSFHLSLPVEAPW